MICSKCQHTFSFNVVEPFFAQQLSIADHKKSQDLFMKSKPKLSTGGYASSQVNAVPVSDVNSETFEEILQHLDLYGITSTAFEATSILCDPKRKSLYFGMRGPQLDHLGCKELSKNPHNNLVETITSPESNSYGVVMLPPSTKRGVKDTKTAIVVLTLRDALALRMEKSNGKYEIPCLLLFIIASFQ